MERVVTRMLEDFEAGKLTRRQLIQRLAVAASTAAAVPVSALGADSAFKTVALDHISYEVTDYRRTRSFYADVLGMTVSGDTGSQCDLNFGGATLIARNRPAASGRGPRVDHIAYRIADWDTEKVKAALLRRGLKPELDTGGAGGPARYASFHVEDPDGFDVQISGVVKPGDALFRR